MCNLGEDGVNVNPGFHNSIWIGRKLIDVLMNLELWNMKVTHIPYNSRFSIKRIQDGDMKRAREQCTK